MVVVSHTSDHRRFAYEQGKHDPDGTSRRCSCDWRRGGGYRRRGRGTQYLNDYPVYQHHVLNPNDDNAIHHHPELLFPGFGLAGRKQQPSVPQHGWQVRFWFEFGLEFGLGLPGWPPAWSDLPVATARRGYASNKRGYQSLPGGCTSYRPGGDPLSACGARQETLLPGERLARGGDDLHLCQLPRLCQAREVDHLVVTGTSPHALRIGA